MYKTISNCIKTLIRIQLTNSGIVAGAGTGVLRTMHCNPDVSANIVPVDMTVNALIASAWDVATNYKDAWYACCFCLCFCFASVHLKSNWWSILFVSIQPTRINTFNYSITDDIPIYNYVSSVENPLTWGEFTDQNIRNGFDYPFSEAIWYISFHMHKTAFMNRIYMVFLHLLPGLLMDFFLMCAGRRPRLLKFYQKIHKFSSVISFFCTNEWVSLIELLNFIDWIELKWNHLIVKFFSTWHFKMFTNTNVQRLWKKIGTRDHDIFDFNIRNVDWEEYSHHYIKGMRFYLFKDNQSTLEAARKKWRRYAKTIALLFLLCLSYSSINWIYFTDFIGCIFWLKLFFSRLCCTPLGRYFHVFLIDWKLIVMNKSIQKKKYNYALD